MPKWLNIIFRGGPLLLVVLFLWMLLSRFERGRVVTRLRWQEIGRDDELGEPVEVQVIGEQAYFEAFVIKFDHEHVGEGDQDRGASVALFRRIFGDQQAPDSAAPLEQLRGMATFDAVGPPSPKERLWARFWEFAEQPATAAQYGVRVAQLEAPAVKVQEGQVWEVTLDAAGGINLKLIKGGSQVARRGEELQE
jgi:hypothetical protein